MEKRYICCDVFELVHIVYRGAMWSQRRFGPVKPSRTRVKEVYIPCYLCEDVVREGLMCLNLIELVHIAPCISSIPGKEGEKRCAACPCTSYTNHTITEIARCIEGYRMSSGGWTVPNLICLHQYKRNKVCRVLMHSFGVVQAHRTRCALTTPNHCL